MRKLYQKSWFGIDFKDLPVKMSNQEVAGVDFYTHFYQEFYKRFDSYKQLPKYWLDLKDEIVEHLSSVVKDKKVLSIGCGNGYIEHKLFQNNITNHIVAIEPGNVSAKWVNKEAIILLDGLFPQAIENDYRAEDFDLVYASGIDYVFNDQQYDKFLKSIRHFGFDKFLLTEIFVSNNDFISLFKHHIKNALSLLGLYDKGQLWGYLRSIDEHKRYLNRAGFHHLEVGQYKHGGYWILAKK
jgi:SAM-dependent methyltransferase